MHEPEDQREILAFLSQASSYGLAGLVERIDTHSAIVFLAGDRAYKLKRAISYPYLDYSTSGLRRQACEAELLLNRRTAPALYIEVRAIRRREDGSLGFGQEGEPVDWVVVMQRFDQDCLFDRIATQGRLTPSLLLRLTDEIIRFHASAEVTHDRGGSEGIRSIIEANRASMLQAAGIVDHGRSEALYKRGMAALGEVTALLDRRAASGHVRRCHGDLHLRNICLLDQQPTLFDCIEFSDEVACIDVLYDLAFLLMDLWHRGLHGEANASFNRYLDLADEADGLPAIPLFISLRAAIRSHVEAAAAALQTSVEGTQGKEDLARSYLALSEETIQRNPARLIAIGGLSGTGKSTLAQAIAAKLAKAPGARILRSDVIRKRMHGIAPEARLSESAYTRRASTDVYRMLYHQTGKALSAGCPVISDAVFASPNERLAIERVARNAGVEFVGIWLDAEPEQLERRLEQRQGDASDATTAVMQRQLGYDTGVIRWIRMAASGSPAETARVASSVLAIDA